LQLIFVCSSERIVKMWQFANVMLKWKMVQFFWLTVCILYSPYNW